MSPQSKMPSVIHAADFSASYAGNFIASLRALGRACEEWGRRSVLILPPAGRQYKWCQDLIAAGLSIHFVPPTPMVRAAKALASIAREENAEILHCHFRAYDTAAWAAQKRLRLAGRRLEVVWHAHSEIPAKGEFLRRIQEFRQAHLPGAQHTDDCRQRARPSAGPGGGLPSDTGLRDPERHRHGVGHCRGPVEGQNRLRAGDPAKSSPAADDGL